MTAKTKHPYSIKAQLSLLGITDAFRAYCLTNPDKQQLANWCRLNGVVHLPQSFRDIRRALECQAPHGGFRPGGGSGKFYSVTGGRAS